MHLRKFVKELHMGALAEMLEDRECYVPTEEETPEIGFIVYELDTPVATAFLRRVEGNYGQIDGVATNINCSSEQRHIALDTAIKACIATADLLGVKQLVAFCKDESTITRSQSLGFAKAPHSLMVYDINSKV